MLTLFISRIHKMLGSRPEPIHPRDLSDLPVGSASGDLECQDLDYEDALFDRELRSFVHSEYGRIKPPSGVYSRLLDTIEQYSYGSYGYGSHTRGSSLLSPLTRLLALLRRSLGSTAVTRMVPSGVALLLVMAAIGPSLSHLFGTETKYRTPISSTPVDNHLSPTHAPLTISQGRARANNGEQSDSVLQQAFYDPTYDAPETWTPLDPGQIKFNSRASITHDAQHEIDPRRSDLGPQ